MGCQSQQEDTELENLNVVLEDTFDGLVSENWSSTQQTTDSGSEPPSNFTLSSAPNFIETHVTQGNVGCFSSNNVSYIDGSLRLSARTQSFLCVNENTARGYSGGELRSVNTYLYGSFQTSLRTSLAAGVFTSIYLYNTTSEIGLHLPGNQPEWVYVSVRESDRTEIVQIHVPVDFQQFGDHDLSSFDASTEAHTYEILWQPDLIDWRIDGHSIFSIQEHDLDTAMQLVLSTWVSSNATLVGAVASQVSAFTDFESFQIEQSDQNLSEN